MEFLTRLAEETGHYFTVKGKRAIFTEFKTIDGLPPALTVFHGDRQLISYSLKAQTADTYSKAKVSYLDQNKKTPTNAEIEDSEIKTGDVLKVSGQRVESIAHADALANSKLHFKNRLAKTGTIDLVGTSSMVLAPPSRWLALANIPTPILSIHQATILAVAVTLVQGHW